jgi:hypothetical protein
MNEEKLPFLFQLNPFQFTFTFNGEIKQVNGKDLKFVQKCISFIGLVCLYL